MVAANTVRAYKYVTMQDGKRLDITVEQEDERLTDIESVGDYDCCLDGPIPVRFNIPGFPAFKKKRALPSPKRRRKGVACFARYGLIHQRRDFRTAGVRLFMDMVLELLFLVVDRY